MLPELPTRAAGDRAGRRAQRAGGGVLTLDTLAVEWEDAQRQAWDALARYKFWMFGYHAGRVVYLATLINRLGGPRLANPFVGLVHLARRAYCRDCGEMRQESHRCTSESLTWTPLFGAEALTAPESGAAPEAPVRAVGL